MNAAPFLLAMEALKASAVLGFPALFGFPAPDAAPVWAVMYLAFGIRRFFRRRSVRYLAIALAETAGFAAVIALALRWGPAASAPGPDWALIASCALAFWRALWLEAKYEAAGSGGADSGSGGAAVHALCAARFDEGVVLFAALLMLSSFLHIEGGAAARAAPVFVVAAIAAIRTAARGGGRPSGAARDARSSAGARGVIGGIAAGAGTFMLAAWALARGLPAARESARDAGLFVLRIAMALLEAIVRFLSALIRPAPLAPRPEEERMARTGAEAFAEQGNSLLGTIMMWLMGLLIAAAVIALIAYLLVQLAGFLRRKTPAAPAGAARPRLADRIRAFLAMIARDFARRYRRMRARLEERRMLRGDLERVPMVAWRVLCRCGARAGSPRAPSETPYAYARRLAVRFPRSARGAPAIADALCLQRYAGAAIPRDELRTLAAAARALAPRRFLAERFGAALRHAPRAFIRSARGRRERIAHRVIRSGK